MAATPSWQNARRICKRIVFALIPTVVFWCMLEAVLAAIGVRPVDTRQDPIVEFEGLESLFVPHDDSGTRMQTRYSKLSLFNDQSFPLEKANGRKRVFCLGGSTTYGRPYDNTSSFAGWMAELLAEIDTQSEWEVINAGGVSYASYRVAAVMEEVLGYDPDLVVVYSANNEYLERRTYAGLSRRSPWLRRLQGFAARTRTYAAISRWKRSNKRKRSRRKVAETLPGEVTERLNKTVGPEDYDRAEVFKPDVLDDYRLNLSRMAEMAQRKGVPLIFVSPAVNARNMSPFKSQFSEGLGDPAEAEIKRLLQESTTALENGEESKSIESAAKAVALDDRFAEAHYRLGQARFVAGEFEEASADLQRAIDEDVCPLRATTQIVQTLKSVAAEYDVPIVDFDAILSNKSKSMVGHDVLGDVFFLDHVHPTIEANGHLAVGIIEAMARNDMAQTDSSQIEPAFRSAQAAIMGRLDVRANGVAMRNLSKVLHWAGKFREAVRPADDAIELLGNDANARLVLADSYHQLGQDQSARIHYEILMRDFPEYTSAYVPYAAFLIDMSKPDAADSLSQAEALLLTAGVVRPDDPHVTFQLARLYSVQRRWSDAREALSLSKESIKDDPILLESIRQLEEHIDAPK
ncbi:MAG: tetratricopeptide repeat protein [Aureliella sp.]